MITHWWWIAIHASIIAAQLVLIRGAIRQRRAAQLAAARAARAATTAEDYATRTAHAFAPPF